MKTGWLRWEQQGDDMLFRDNWGTLWKVRVIDHGPRECPLEIECVAHEEREPGCPRCGSTDFEYIGAVQRCVECGK